MCFASPRNTLRQAAGLPPLQPGVRRDGSLRRSGKSRRVVDDGMGPTPAKSRRVIDNGMGPRRRSLFGG